MNKVTNSSGYALLGVLFIVMLFGIGAMSTLNYADFVTRRTAEGELIDIGKEYSHAIQSYYQTTPGGMGRYPRSLDDLVEDNRFPEPKRHLRQIYRDPTTGQIAWGTVTAPDGGVMGVYSLNEDEPIREVAPADSKLMLPSKQDEKGYGKWVFGYAPYVPPQTANASSPAATK